MGKADRPVPEPLTSVPLGEAVMVEDAEPPWPERSGAAVEEEEPANERADPVWLGEVVSVPLELDRPVEPG